MRILVHEEWIRYLDRSGDCAEKGRKFLNLGSLFWMRRGRLLHWKLYLHV